MTITLRRGENSFAGDQQTSENRFDGVRQEAAALCKDQAQWDFFGSFYRSNMSVIVDDGGRQVDTKPGDKVFDSFVGTAQDEKIFPNLNNVRIDRLILSAYK